jgi:hypothetical protein
MSQRFFFFFLDVLPGGEVALRLGGSDFFVLAAVRFSIASASASGCVNRRCSYSSLEELASFKKIVSDTAGHALFKKAGDGDMLE